jgi:hypothetical protein
MLFQRAAEFEPWLGRIRVHDDHVRREVADATQILVGKIDDADHEILAVVIFGGHLRQRRRAFSGGQHVQ